MVFCASRPSTPASGFAHAVLVHGHASVYFASDFDAAGPCGLGQLCPRRRAFGASLAWCRLQNQCFMPSHRKVLNAWEWSRGDELFWEYGISSRIILIVESCFVILLPECWCGDLLWLGGRGGCWSRDGKHCFHQGGLGLPPTAHVARDPLRLNGSSEAGDTIFSSSLVI